MNGRTFLDTNVLVYAVDDAETRKRDVARGILAAADPAELVLSTQVLGEFYVVVTRKLADPMSEADAARAVDDLAKLPTVFTDSSLVKAGIATSRRSHVSFWDGLILAAAAAGGCERVLTEDLAGGTQIGSVRIENPFAGGSLS